MGCWGVPHCVLNTTSPDRAKDRAIHSPDRAKDPKTPQVDGGDGTGGSPEDEEDVTVAERPVASESSSDDADDEGLQ